MLAVGWNVLALLAVGWGVLAVLALLAVLAWCYLCSLLVVVIVVRCLVRSHCRWWRFTGTITAQQKQNKKNKLRWCGWRNQSSMLDTTESRNFANLERGRRQIRSNVVMAWYPVADHDGVVAGGRS